VESEPEGTPEAIIGVQKEHNIKERIVAIIRDNSEPPFVPEAHLVNLPGDQTKCVLVIHAHESDSAHKASNGYYYRTENQSIPIRPEFVAKIIGKEKVKEDIKKAIEAVRPKIEPVGAGIRVDNNCWLGIICCPVPPESLKLPIFSEKDWYYEAGRNAIASMGSFDIKSTAESLKVIKGSIAVPTGVIEYFENGLVLCCLNLYTDKVHEDVLNNKLTKILELIRDTYNKNAFNGAALLIIDLGNIEGRKWTTGNTLKDMMMDISASEIPCLELDLQTTVSALNSDVKSVAQQIKTKWQRHFNIF
jgi:hypothetical protein